MGKAINFISSDLVILYLGIYFKETVWQCKRLLYENVYQHQFINKLTTN